MTYKSALDIIKEHLDPETASKFHSNSRKPFPEESVVIQVAREAAETIMKQRGSTTLFNQVNKKI